MYYEEMYKVHVQTYAYMVTNENGFLDCDFSLKGPKHDQMSTDFFT